MGVDGARTVAVTGIGGLLGRRLLARLLDDPAVARVVGLDVEPPADLPRDERLDLRRADVRDPGIGEHLAGIDALVHLAFVLDPMRDEDTMRDVNVGGTRNVFEAAAAAGVRKVVYTSSVVAYGGHSDNDLPLTEESPLRANPGFNYAEHKYEVERWLWPWLEERGGDLTVTVLRPAIVAGPGVENFISRQFELLRPVAVRGYRPPWQFAHVEDVASALQHVVDHDLPGAFNIACEGWISYEELLAVTGTRPIELPEEVAFTLAERLWRLGLAEAPPGELHYIMHPMVMSVDKLVATGWSPQHTNREALRQLHEEHRPYVTLARGVRLRRRDLRVGAGLTGGLLAGVALRRALRSGPGVRG